jgi:predicted HTH domain antitoxin
LEKSFVPFNDVVDLVRSGKISVAYGAEQLGMTVEGFREALEQAGVHVAEES